MQRLLKIQRGIVCRGIVSLVAMSLTCGIAQAQSASVKGAGATFPLPLYKVWFANFKAVKQIDKGIAESIKTKDGTIGYLDAGTARANMLSVAAIKNRAGKFVLPEPSNIAAALDVYAGSGKFGTKVLVDPTGTDSYPIVTLTYLFLYKQSKNRPVQDAVVAFTEWIQQPEQQAECKNLQYVPLPASLVKQNSQVLSRLHSK